MQKWRPIDDLSRSLQIPNILHLYPRLQEGDSLSVQLVVLGLPVYNHGVSTICKGLNSQLLGGDEAEQKQAYWIFYFHPEVHSSWAVPVTSDVHRNPVPGRAHSRDIQGVALGKPAKKRENWSKKPRSRQE